MYSVFPLFPDKEAADWAGEVIPADHGFVRALGVLSRDLNMAVGITLQESCGTGPGNTLILFDHFGDQVLHYSKVHTCDFDVERNLTPEGAGSRGTCVMEADETDVREDYRK